MSYYKNRNNFKRSSCCNQQHYIKSNVRNGKPAHTDFSELSLRTSHEFSEEFYFAFCQRVYNTYRRLEFAASKENRKEDNIRHDRAYHKTKRESQNKRIEADETAYPDTYSARDCGHCAVRQKLYQQLLAPAAENGGKQIVEKPRHSDN